jgi:hypothetical protein
VVDISAKIEPQFGHVDEVAAEEKDPEGVAIDSDAFAASTGFGGARVLRTGDLVRPMMRAGDGEFLSKFLYRKNDQLRGSVVLQRIVRTVF